MVINQNMSDSVHTLENYQAAAAMLPVPGENSTTGAPPGAPPYGAPPYGGLSTSTSTFTANYPAPAATSSYAAPPPPPPPPAVTTSEVAPASLTTSSLGVATFTGDAVALRLKKMGAAAGGAVAAGAFMFL